MNEILNFLQLGFEHITELDGGYDHLLFVLALSAIYTFSEWRNVLVLVTAFTIGHSITLVLTVANISPIPSKVIEWLIPFSIVLTCIFNLLESSKEDSPGYKSMVMLRRYLIALFFGLIHGLGFANFLRQMVPSDRLLVALFSFNVGLEIGQLLIVFIGLSVGYLLMRFTAHSKREWKLLLTGIVLLFALHLLFLQTQNLFS